MPSTTATVGALLHEDIAPGIANQLNNETPALDSFTTVKNARIVGRNRVRGVRVNRNRGGYYTAEGGAPPVAGTPQIEEMRVPLRYYHHAMSFTKQVLDASETDKGAFEDVMRLGSEDIVDGIKRQRNQALWGDGRGVRCLVNGTVTASGTIIADAPGGIAGADDGTRYLNVGDWVGFVTPAGALRVATAHRITAINSSTTFTITPTVTLVDNDLCVKCVETAGALTIENTEYMHMPMGLNGMIDAGAWVNILHGISRTTFPVMSSTVIGTTALPVGAVSADLLQRACDASRKVSGKNTDEIWLESGAKRAYLTIMEKDRRYTATDLQTPNAGTSAASARGADTGLRFGKIPIMEDFDCPYGFIYGLNKQGALRFPGPEGFLNDDGTTLHMSITAIDQWDAFYRHFENFTHEQPNTCWKLVGCTVDVVSAHVI